MKEKMYASSVAGEKLPIYVVGVEYDDFSEGGFAIIAVCDNSDVANKMVEKTYKKFPAIKKNSVSIRTLKLNKFYNNWI